MRQGAGRNGEAGVREARRPWSAASELTRPWREAVATAGLPAGLVPYCLRHSSIVRGLRAGLPVRLVAAAHDTSAAMVERHYGRFIVDAAEDLLRRAAVPLAPGEMSAASTTGTLGATLWPRPRRRN